VRLGGSAVPSIEEAIDSIEERGRESEFSLNSGWLLYAYAKIKGPAAYPRLKRMVGRPNLGFLAYSLDTSIALSLALTSYVDSFRVPAKIVCRTKEPRDALDQVILAWERNDRRSFEAVLGPSAKVGLRSFLGGRTWTATRVSLWHGRPGGSVAVGYTFESGGSWAEPEETLSEAVPVNTTSVDISKFPVNPEIPTAFTNSSGRDCGTYRVEFLSSRDEMGRLAYLLNNPDLGDLVRLITSCAAEAK